MKDSIQSTNAEEHVVYIKTRTGDQTLRFVALIRSQRSQFDTQKKCSDNMDSDNIFSTGRQTVAIKMAK